MSTKVPLAVLARTVKADGYTGNAQDAAAIKKYCADNKIESIEFDGEEHVIADLNYDAPKVKGKKLAAKADDDNTLPDDFNEKVEAAVTQRLKKAGWSEGFRFASPDKPAVSVKSGAERQYEDRVKTGKAVWSDYWEAKSVTEMFQIKCLHATGKMGQAQELVKKHNEWMSQKGYTSLTEQTGGALVPEGYDAVPIRLVKEYGVARKVCRQVDMTTNEYNRPKVTSTSGLTVYYPNEGAAGTESTETWGRTQLKAKMGVVIVKMSRQIIDDSEINLMEDTTREAARAIAKIEDNTLFNGTGVYASGSYIPGCNGITNLLDATGSSDSRHIKSGQTTAGAATITELISTMALLPQYARTSMTAWHCTPEMSNLILTRLGAAMGGVTWQEFQGFGDLPMVLGRPIITNNVMPNDNNTSTGRTNLLYGDISLAADFGSRQNVEIEVSDQRYWDESNLALKATVRHDINVHDVGSSSTQSPVVALSQT